MNACQSTIGAPYAPIGPFDRDNCCAPEPYYHGFGDLSLWDGVCKSAWGLGWLVDVVNGPTRCAVGYGVRAQAGLAERALDDLDGWIAER